MSRLKKFKQNAKGGLYQQPKIKHAVLTCADNVPGLRAALNNFEVTPKVSVSSNKTMFPLERNFACWAVGLSEKAKGKLEGELFFHPSLEEQEAARIFGIVCHEMGHLLVFENEESLEELYPSLDEEQLADAVFEEATGLEIWYDLQLLQHLVVPPEDGESTSTLPQLKGFTRHRPKGLV